VALPDDSLGCFANDGKRLYEKVVEVFTSLKTRAKLGGLAAKYLVGEGGNRWLKGVDLGHDSRKCLDFLAFAGTQNAI
jgi:hypothetical protein